MRIWVGTSGYNYPEWKGSFYPAKFPAAKMLSYYARAARYRRDQLHLLSHAEREDPRRLECRDAAGIQAHAQGAQAHHAHRPAQGLRRPAAVLPQDRGHAGAEARRDPLPAAALLPQGPRDAGRISAAAPAGHLRRVRIPPRLVDGRGSVCAAQGARSRPVRRRQREVLHPRRDHRELRLLPAAR